MKNGNYNCRYREKIIVVDQSLYFQIPIPETCEVISSVPLFPIPAESPENEFGYNQIVSDLSSDETEKNKELTVGLGQAET